MKSDYAFLNQIRDAVLANRRLTPAEALRLFSLDDVGGIGQIADAANRRVNGDRVFFNVNRHINPTNLCVLKCAFCAFSARPGDAHAFKHSREEILEKGRKAARDGVTEIHIVGGLEPNASFEEYRLILEELHRELPSIHLKAFTAVEIDYFARITRRSVPWVLDRLREAGLGSMPGGGAEIFSSRARKELCKGKISGERWLEIHQIAHKRGIRTNATMLYGHVETYEERVDHLERIRRLQDKTHGFNVFIPLAFQPENTRVVGARGTTGLDDLKTLAISRLYLDNFQHIKAYWVMLTEPIAQLSLHFGVDDLDGTVGEEWIAQLAGGQTAGKMARAQIEDLIRGAGKRPMQRDTLYNPIAEVA